MKPNKLIEALKKLVPAEDVKELSSVIEEMFSEAVKDIEETKEKEYNEKLEEAYAEISKDLEEAEKVAIQGYQEAHAIIVDQQNRELMLKREFEQEIKEGFEEAYEQIEAEKAKNESLAVEIYEEYDQKLKDMKDYIVEKLDEFLHRKGAEIYEQAKRDVINDPRMAEHRVAMDRITDIVARYLSEEDYALATSSKLEEAYSQIEKLQGQMKMMEGRNINLSRENTKLTEEVRRTHNILNESAESKRKDRSKKSEGVSGRGHRRMPGKNDEQVIIKEQVGNNNVEVHEADNNTLMEHLGLDINTLQSLAGVTQPK